MTYRLTDILLEVIEATVYDNSSGAPFWGNIGAGVLPIATTTKRILAAYRSKYVNEPNTWGVIGGKLDNDDGGVMASAKREFIEETGYSGSVKLIPGYVFKASGFEYHNFIGIVGDEFVPDLDWETETTKWVTYDELLELSPKHFGLEKLLNDKKSMEIIKKFTGSE